MTESRDSFFSAGDGGVPGAQADGSTVTRFVTKTVCNPPDDDGPEIEICIIKFSDNAHYSLLGYCAV
jgi:hypothetical protein